MKRMSKAPIAPQILQAITSRPGQIVYREEIMKETGLNATQVSTTLLRKVKEFPKEFEVISTGHAWRYHPNGEKKEGSKCFEQLMVLQEVSTVETKAILRDEDGTVYHATLKRL